ncbi:hypothetical protein [Herbaspirillum sp. NPDC087042]|uniref:hypothetical protein n=1 Tax=Herbaspirillum sp. NPDC087042 TaxID=3364004 RepID=UPI00382C3306
MSLTERLADFAGAVGGAATNAPDDYPEWSYATYETNMADIRQLWAEIFPKLKRDIEQAAFIDLKLLEAFAAFEAGEKDKGQLAMWDIYNLQVKKLR